MKSRDVPPAPGSHFTVLIADLEGDDERLSQTSHVEAALAGHEGLEVVRIGSGPRLAALAAVRSDSCKPNGRRAPASNTRTGTS